MTVLDVTCSGRQFGAEKLMRCYHETLDYSSLTMHTQIRKTYGDDVISVTADNFTTWALKVLEMFLDCMGMERSTWLAPAHFCCVGFINGSRFLPGDKSTLAQQRPPPRRNIESFAQMSSPKSAFELTDNQMTAAMALRNICIGKKLYTDHGSEYTFPEL